MKQISLHIMTALMLATTLASCDVVGGIFKAGFYSAIIVLVLVVILVIWLLKRFRR